MKSSLEADGRRAFVHPADVSGRFTTLRRWVFLLLIAVYVALPWIPINGHPAVFLDVEHRHFFLFGMTFNAQDVWLMFFLLTGVGFSLIVLTALFGRVWCGYACPQTVFLDGVFRRVERLLEGPHLVRLRRNRRHIDWDKIWRKSIKHAIFVLLSAAVAHVFLSYFVSLPKLWRMMQEPPGEHPMAFGIVLFATAVMYGNFAFFREQLCLIVCPYGRLQSVLTDADTLIIGYDAGRGEPRGKSHDAKAGSCVDCGRCVAVCPTGIDIRNGLQVDCIGCAACIDACDEIMGKLDRPPGLVRYDSLRGLGGQPRRFLRPRLLLYAALGLVGLIVATVSVGSRQSFEANLLRARGAPFTVDGDRIRNAFEIHIINKETVTQHFELQVPGGALEYTLPIASLDLAPLESRTVPVMVTAAIGSAPAGVTVTLVRTTDATRKVLAAPFLQPR